MINLTVNGKPRPVDDDMDLESYLDSFGLDLKHVAVGYNGDVLKREQYPEVVLRDGDILEIVRPVGGG
ncbi:MAG: sulfur carrier protein ThiS [Chloroflexi bacterium]|nr:sulfur carrier protein ThiS [Chloroflexota bacterium]MYE41441.1 sulfur carrier protein ThiS [Chloroflexota bacterium]